MEVVMSSMKGGVVVKRRSAVFDGGCVWWLGDHRDVLAVKGVRGFCSGFVVVLRGGAWRVKSTRLRQGDRRR
jgi:hypothetical protein